jgi:hypothetical protein
MQAQSELVVVEGGDHSLVVRKGELSRQGRTQAAVDESLLEAVERFASKLRG